MLCPILNVSVPIGLDGWYIKAFLNRFKVADLFVLLHTFLDWNFVADLLGYILAVTVAILWTLFLIHGLALIFIFLMTVIFRFGFTHLF